MDPNEESNRKTAFERDRIRSQVGSPLAPQVARNPEQQEKSDAEKGSQQEAEAPQREPRARQQEAAAQKQEATATAAGAAEEAAKKIPGAGAAISGIAKTFPILWLIISFKSKFDAQSVFTQIIVKVLTWLLGPFVWPILVFISHFTPKKLLPKTTDAERMLVLLVFILFILAIAAIALIFLCFTLGGLVTRAVFTTGVNCGI